MAKLISCAILPLLKPNQEGSEMQNIESLKAKAERLYRMWQNDKVSFDTWWAAQEKYERASQH